MKCVTSLAWPLMVLWVCLLLDGSDGAALQFISQGSTNLTVHDFVSPSSWIPAQVPSITDACLLSLSNSSLVIRARLAESAVIISNLTLGNSSLSKVTGWDGVVQNVHFEARDSILQCPFFDGFPNADMTVVNTTLNVTSAFSMDLASIHLLEGSRLTVPLARCSFSSNATLNDSSISFFLSSVRLDSARIALHSSSVLDFSFSAWDSLLIKDSSIFVGDSSKCSLPGASIRESADSGVVSSVLSVSDSGSFVMSTTPGLEFGLESSVGFSIVATGLNSSVSINLVTPFSGNYVSNGLALLSSPSTRSFTWVDPVAGVFEDGTPGLFSFREKSKLNFYPAFDFGVPVSSLGDGSNRSVLSVFGVANLDEEATLNLYARTLLRVRSGGSVRGGGGFLLEDVRASSILVDPANCNCSSSAAGGVLLDRSSRIRTMKGDLGGWPVNDALSDSGVLVEGDTNSYLSAVMNVGYWQWTSSAVNTTHEIHVPFHNYGQTVVSNCTVLASADVWIGSLSGSLKSFYDSSCANGGMSRGSLNFESGKFLFRDNSSVDGIAIPTPPGASYPSANMTNSTFSVWLTDGFVSGNGEILGADLVNSGGRVGEWNSTWGLTVDRSYVHYSGNASIVLYVSSWLDHSWLRVRNFDVRGDDGLTKGDVTIVFGSGFDPYRGLSLELILISDSIFFSNEEGEDTTLSLKHATVVQETLSTGEEKFFNWLARAVTFNISACSAECQACAGGDLNFTWNAESKKLELLFENSVCRDDPNSPMAAHGDAQIPSDLVAVYYAFGCFLILTWLMCTCLYTYCCFRVARLIVSGRRKKLKKIDSSALDSNLVLVGFDDDETVLGKNSLRGDGEAVVAAMSGEMINLTEGEVEEVEIELYEGASDEEQVLYTL